jgi:hypothetical protein
MACNNTNNIPANPMNPVSQIFDNYEDQVDYEFMVRVQNEVTQSCALPFALPVDRIPEYIIQAAQWFWLNDDQAVEERYYIIPNYEICKCNQFNKILQLPHQIQSVFGCYKVNSGLKYGAMGDFSIERMMMSTYSMFGGVGTVAGGFTGQAGMAGFNLSDVITSMYEIDTFNQNLNPTLSYNFNIYSHKLVILGDMDWSDILITCWKRCRIQDLYNNPYFFRYVVALCKRALSTIYGTFEFKLPGGVTINYSDLSDRANDEIEKIEEYIENQHAVDYFFMPNTL